MALGFISTVSALEWKANHDRRRRQPAKNINKTSSHLKKTKIMIFFFLGSPHFLNWIRYRRIASA
jgi:hypothetical protein